MSDARKNLVATEKEFFGQILHNLPLFSEDDKKRVFEELTVAFESSYAHTHVSINQLIVRVGRVSSGPVSYTPPEVERLRLQVRKFIEEVCKHLTLATSEIVEVGILFSRPKKNITMDNYCVSARHIGFAMGILFATIEYGLCQPYAVVPDISARVKLEHLVRKTVKSTLNILLQHERHFFRSETIGNRIEEIKNETVSRLPNKSRSLPEQQYALIEDLARIFK